MSSAAPDADVLRWSNLSPETRELLAGKLAGFRQATGDAGIFDSWPADKQQALLLLLRRMHAKQLWFFVKQITNVYGEGGVGIGFRAWPMIESSLSRRRDFTRLFASHSDTDGGFYEKGRSDAALHFLFKNENPRQWYVHFDRYSPVHSFVSAVKHLRHESLGGLKPDWRMITKCLNPCRRERKIY